VDFFFAEAFFFALVFALVFVVLGFDFTFDATFFFFGAAFFFSAGVSTKIAVTDRLGFVLVGALTVDFFFAFEGDDGGTSFFFC